MYVSSLAKLPGFCLSITYIDDEETESQFIVFRFRIKMKVYKKDIIINTSCDFLDISISKKYDDSYIKDTVPDNKHILKYLS